MSWGQGAGHQPNGAACLRRAGVFGSAPTAAGTRCAAFAGPAAGFSVHRFVRPASHGGKAGFLLDHAERRRYRADLPAFGRSAAGHRTGRRPNQGSPACRFVGADRQQAGAADRRRAGPARTPAHPAAGHRLESRSVDGGGTEALPAALGFCGRLHLGSGRGRLQRARGFRDRCARRRHVAGGQEPAEPDGSRRCRAALQHARDHPRIR